MPKGIPLQRFTEDETNRVRSDYLAYVPVRDTAYALNRDIGTIRQHILKLNLRRSHTISVLLRNLPSEWKAQAVRLPKEEFLARARAWIHANVSEAARLHQEEKARIRAYVKFRLDQIFASPSMERVEKMVMMRREGATLEEVGDLFGITRERVRQLTTEHIYVIRNRRELQGVANALDRFSKLKARSVDRLLQHFDGSPEAVQVAFIQELKKRAGLG